MASPTRAADMLEAWRQDNFGWLTQRDNNALKLIVKRLRRQAHDNLIAETAAEMDRIRHSQGRA